MRTSITPSALIRILVSAVVAVLLIPILAACSPAETPKANTPNHEEVIIAGVRANSSAIPVQQVVAALSEITEKGDRVAVISADGKPRVMYDVTLGTIPTNDNDKADYFRHLDERVVQAVAQSKAVEPQSDMIAALGLAGRSFSDGPVVKRLDVYDSMLSTAGMYSMLRNGLYADPADRVAAVKDQSELPKLSGVEVHAPLFGDVTAPQQPLDSAAYASLRNQWMALFAAVKAQASLAPSSTTSIPQPYKPLPFVSPVSVRRPEPPAALGCTQSLPDNVIGFEGDLAVFVDPVAAAAAVQGLASALRRCPGTIEVDGYTSSVGPQSVDLPLSRERAGRVAGLLADALHMDVRSIRIIGYGNAGLCRVKDRDAQGHLVEALAAQNRKTIVTRQNGTPSASSCG